MLSIWVTSLHTQSTVQNYSYQRTFSQEVASEGFSAGDHNLSLIKFSYVQQISSVWMYPLFFMTTKLLMFWSYWLFTQVLSKFDCSFCNVLFELQYFKKVWLTVTRCNRKESCFKFKTYILRLSWTGWLLTTLLPLHKKKSTLTM